MSTGLRQQIHGQPITGLRHDRLEQAVDRLDRQPQRQQARLEAVVEKMSAKLGAITQRMPYSSSAQTACSREEPQPKFSRASRMLAPW